MRHLVLALCSSVVALALSASVGSAQLNLAAGCPATASGVYLSQTADLAVDADTVTSRWVAPATAAWIELDLGSEYPVSSVVGKPAMTSNGAIVHNITGRTAAGVTKTLGRFSGDAYNERRLLIACDDSTPVRYVRVTSVSSVTWIAWIDLQVYSGSSVPTGTKDNSWGRIKSMYR